MVHKSGTKRIALASLTLLCTAGLIGGAPATAGKSVKWKSGSYYGETSQGKGIFFSVKKKKAGPFGGNYVLDCGGSGKMTVDLHVPDTKIKKDGRFKAVQSGPGTHYVKGRLKGKKATGTLRVKFTTGATCDTGVVKWKAKRTGR